MGYWVRYCDDRAARLASGYLRTAGRARRSGMPRDAARRAMKAVNNQGALLGLTFGCGLVAANYLVGAVMPARLNSLGYFFGGAFILALGLAVQPLIGPMAIRSHKRGFLREGHCPACGYGLAEIEPEADGCRVCPECGAAWAMDAATGGACA